VIRDRVAGRGTPAVVVVLAILLAAGCGSAPGSPGPVGSPSPLIASHVPGPPGLDWAVAAEIERPEGMSADPPSISPVAPNGGLGHPGHFSGQGDPFDVARIGDRLVAPGYTYPAFHAVTWTSTDREHWSLAGLSPGRTGAFGLGIAAGPGRAVIVGRIDNDAAAWSSTDGVTWQQVDGGGAFVEAPETRMTAVVSTSAGFVAGGFAGITNQPGVARFWTSPDGRSWARVADQPAFADGRVASIVSTADGLVAVGTTGPVGRATGSAVWRSRDGVTWERVPGSKALTAGAIAGITAGGPGLVAVGASLDETRALVWLSKDGLAWQLAPDQESLTYHGLRITMADVTAGADGTLVAVGHFLFGSQFGQGTTWTSKDGSTWTRAPDLAAFGQGEPAAVIADGPVYVAVGTVGAPDNYIPTVWISPPGG
jgi:hypothetical protein